MIQTAPHRHATVRSRSEVPAELRDSVILLHFVRPIPRWLSREFYQVQPSRELLLKAEERFYLTERFQPQAALPPLCPSCGMVMVRLNEMESKCLAAGCTLFDGRDSRAVRVVTGPKRGVINVLIASDFVVGNHGAGRGELIDRCALVLDRRYDDAARQAFYRLAGVVCEITSAWAGVDMRLR